MANGADKLFYVQLRMPPGLPSEDEVSGFVESASLLTNEGQPQPIYFAYRTVLQKLARFEAVEKIEEQVQGHRIEVGRYRFVVDGRPVYVLWGQGEQLEASGAARVTDVLGHEETAELASITLTDSLHFVEPESGSVIHPAPTPEVAATHGEAGTAAQTRVLIDSACGTCTWSTVGSSTNIIEASWQALAHSLEYGLLIYNQRGGRDGWQCGGDESTLSGFHDLCYGSNSKAPMSGAEPR